MTCKKKEKLNKMNIKSLISFGLLIKSTLSTCSSGYVKWKDSDEYLYTAIDKCYSSIQLLESYKMICNSTHIIRYDYSSYDCSGVANDEHPGLISTVQAGNGNSLSEVYCESKSNCNYFHVKAYNASNGYCASNAPNTDFRWLLETFVDDETSSCTNGEKVTSNGACTGELWKAEWYNSNTDPNCTANSADSSVVVKPNNGGSPESTYTTNQNYWGCYEVAECTYSAATRQSITMVIGLFMFIFVIFV